MTGRVIRLRGIKSYRHPKSGILYHYHRATGTRLKALYGSAEFVQELRGLEEKQKAKQAQKAIPGTLGLAIGKWRATPDWFNLKPKTRVSYERAIAILQPLEDMPLVEITRPFILDLRTKIFAKRGRWMSNYSVTVLRLILGFAVDRGWLGTNPLAEGVKKIRKAADEADANRPWSETECAIVLDRASPSLHLALALAMCAGLRKADFLTVTRAALRNETIIVRTSKRGVNVAVPLHPILADAISKRSESDAVQIAVNSRGQPWTETGFNASWRKFKKRLEAEGLVEPGLTPHGLRHTLGTRLREAGADDRTIADILGQKSVSMARHYSENAALPSHAGVLVRGLKHTEAKNKS